MTINVVPFIGTHNGEFNEVTCLVDLMDKTLLLWDAILAFHGFGVQWPLISLMGTKESF